jgi:hypothetical protein
MRCWFRALKRNSNDEDVLQQREDPADETAQSYDSSERGCIETRQENELRGKQQLQGRAWNDRSAART